MNVIWNLMRGLLAALLLALNTLVVCIPLYLMGFIRMFTRGPVRTRLNRQMDRIIDIWVGFNRLWFRALDLAEARVTWENADDLAPDRWYLIISNHQSWADILILQNTFRDHLPAIKFFTKQQLIWVPLLGVAMWLLGFPYVRRMSRERIAANPELMTLDRKTTLASCAKFRDHPTTVLNFVEGTRFTPDKHHTQNARFDHLLNPKLGGLSYAITGLGDRLHKLIDVTISYPDGVPSFWDLLCGRCHAVELKVQARDVPAPVREAPGPEQVRTELTPWVEALWREKDARLEQRRELAN